MTANQIAYWNLKEQIRSNQAQERIKGDTLKETQRSNLINEQLKDRELFIKAMDVNSQIERREHQNATDTATAVWNGINTLVSNPISALGKLLN